MNQIRNWLWGLVFIGIGVIFGLNALDITDIDIFFDGWWTLFIIIPCFIGLLKDDDKMGDGIGLIIGICLLLGCLDFISFDILWKLAFPIILVLIGISFIFKDFFSSKVRKELSKLSHSESQEYCATFGSQTVDFSQEEFKGCSLSAVFGGIKCDLRDAIFQEDVCIHAHAIFGGITIYVPKDVKVKIVSTSVFGGVSNERKEKEQDGKITLFIDATSVFGGVEIK